MYENSKKKIPDCLADSCKLSSINQMAAGSRLPRSSHGFFLLSNISVIIIGLCKAFDIQGSAFTSFFPS